MNESTYLLDLHYKDTGVQVSGLVGESVIDKIRKKLFVEFNLIIDYNELEGEEEVAYRRYYYSPVGNVKASYTKING